MGEYNVSQKVPFWDNDMIIKEVIASNDKKHFDLEGKTVGDFCPGEKQSLEDFKNRFILKTTEKSFPECDWIEFTI